MDCNSNMYKYLVLSYNCVKNENGLIMFNTSILPKKCAYIQKISVISNIIYSERSNPINFSVYNRYIVNYRIVSKIHSILIAE